VLFFSLVVVPALFTCCGGAQPLPHADERSFLLGQIYQCRRYTVFTRLDLRRKSRHDQTSELRAHWIVKSTYLGLSVTVDMTYFMKPISIFVRLLYELRTERWKKAFFPHVAADPGLMFQNQAHFTSCRATTRAL
jgi:CRISPR/Cas system-associated protein endoribonuclease Cas2